MPPWITSVGAAISPRRYSASTSATAASMLQQYASGGTSERPVPSRSKVTTAVCPGLRSRDHDQVLPLVATGLGILGSVALGRYFARKGRASAGVGNPGPAPS